MNHFNSSIDQTTNNNDMKNVYKIPDNYNSTLSSMSEIKKCVEKISSLQKVLKEGSNNSRSSFDQVDRSRITTELAMEKQILDGNYFLKLLKSEQDRLLSKAAEVEVEIDLLTQSSEEVSEDVLGFLRSVSGKARLLVSQKMKQFEGLCHKNLIQKSDEKFRTTNEDLQGFWDMVKLQVNHVDSLFEEFENLKANNWKLKDETDSIKIPSGSKIVRKPLPSKIVSSANDKKTSSNDVNGAEKREARRKELLELKRKNKTAMINRETQPKDPNALEFFF